MTSVDFSKTELVNRRGDSGPPDESVHLVTVASDEDAIAERGLQHQFERSAAQSVHSKTNSYEAKGHGRNEDYVRLFCVNLSLLPDWIIWCVLFVTLMTGFIAIGTVEEGFKVTFPSFTMGWFMTAIELLLFSLFASIERLTKCECTKYTPTVARSASPPTQRRSQTPDTEMQQLLTDAAAEPRSAADAALAAAKAKGDSLEKPSILSRSFSSLSRITEREVELKHHFLVAAFMTMARGLTNIALLYLNYPTQVVFKSMKLITVMIGAKMFFGKKYNVWEYTMAPILVTSAALFSLGDTWDALEFNVIGTVSVVVSLLFDSCHSNYQQYVLQLHKDTVLELLVYSNFFGALMTAAIGVATLETPALVAFLSTHSVADVLAWFFVRVACLYVGVSAFVAFMKKFGSVAATTVTTIRKILTVILSYILWPEAKAFTKQHAFGTLLFFLALAINAWGIREKDRVKKPATSSK